ncbi:hypothetical protein AGR9A_Lc40434 [Agrobacterium salinitolerans str. Hayward 0363]|nr:hypothetical protein AGR9A_Lc40434 [Agrobacterium salinitolerans str. Hayward 0363]
MHGGACRRMIYEIFLEDSVKARKIPGIVQPDIDLDHIRKRTIGKRQNVLDIRNHLLGLRHDPAGYNLAIDGGHLPGNINEISGPDGLGKWPPLSASLIVRRLISYQFRLLHRSSQIIFIISEIFMIRSRFYDAFP